MATLGESRSWRRYVDCVCTYGVAPIHVWRSIQSLAGNQPMLTLLSGAANGCTNFGGGSGMHIFLFLLSLSAPDVCALCISSGVVFNGPYEIAAGGQLTPGVPFWVRVSAINSVGRGLPTPASVINDVSGPSSVRALPPRSPALAPTSVIVQVWLVVRVCETCTVREHVVPLSLCVCTCVCCYYVAL